MSWQYVVFVLGIILISCSTFLCGLHLLFRYLDRRKKSGEYKLLKELLERMVEGDKN